MPPHFNAERAPNSQANFWRLTWADIADQQYLVSTTSKRGEVFRQPHAVVSGVVVEAIAEDDGDHHLWVRLDDDPKSRFAVEFVPELQLRAPPAGTHADFYGIVRYDLAHRWLELHPCTFWRAS